MSHVQKVVYWLLDIVLPNFISKFGREQFDGKILIASRQLWSLISEAQVRSALIGPGYLKGVIKKTSGGIEFEEPVNGIIFDPTELRRTEPLPLVNIISPDVIDPLEESSEQEIKSLVRRVVIARGNPLVQQKIAEVKTLTTIPTVEHTSTSKVKIEVKLTSGKARAEFALKGIHRKIYDPYVKRFLKDKDEYGSFEKLKMFWADRRELLAPTKETLSPWAIIEQSALQPESVEASRDGYDQVACEYKRTIDFVKANSSSYMFR